MRLFLVVFFLVFGCSSTPSPSPSPSASVRTLRTPLELREVQSRMAGACSRPLKPPPGGLVATADGSECLVLAPPSLTVSRVARLEARVVEGTGEWAVTVTLAPDQVAPFDALTGRLEGQRLAFVAGRDVLAAPLVAAALTDGIFDLPAGSEAEARALVTRLAG
jgi:preprotein translocase subunit SecD